MSFEEFQDGRYGNHLGYQNATILAILNLYVAPMPLFKFQDLWFGGRCRLKNFKMAAVRPSWISERNDFSNSESLCHCNASHQVLAQSNLRFGPSSIQERNDFSNSESLCHCDASHQVLAQSDIRFGRGCCLNNFKMAAKAAILDIGTERF